MILPIGAAVACLFGVLLGAPTLKLRGDYLAIVTLGFGEIIRIFLNNLSQPFNITNGPQGIARIDPIRFVGIDFGKTDTVGALAFTGPIKYYYLLLVVVIVVIVVNLRLQNSRIGRAWEAIREDEIAARAMGINTTQHEAARLRHGRVLRRHRRRHVLRDPGLHQPRELRAGRDGHGARDGGAGRHGQHLGRDPRRAAALVRARDPALHGRAAAAALFGRTIIEPEVIRMLLFGLAMVLMMLFRPGGLLPSAVRKRELAGSRRD